MKVTVNKSTDISLGGAAHKAFGPPAFIIAPGLSPSVEMVATQFWPPGYALNQNKLTTTVRHQGRNIALKGHDQGALILDITVLCPVNLLYPLVWPFSSRKIMFSSSKVKMNKTEVGAAQVGLPPLTMLTCGDPANLPTAITPLNRAMNSVQCGVTAWDLIAGVVGIVVSMAVDLIADKWAPFESQDWKRNFTYHLETSILKKTLGIDRKIFVAALGGLVNDLVENYSKTGKLKGSLKFEGGGWLIKESISFNFGGGDKVPFVSTDASLLGRSIKRPAKKAPKKK